MLMIYSPTDLSSSAQRDLEDALEKDEARVHYTGSDGSTEFIVMEAHSFDHTHEVERQHGLSLAWQKAALADAAPDRPDFLAELAALSGKRRRKGRKEK